MKKLITLLLFTLLSFVGFAQRTSDTTTTGWKTIIHYPSGYDTELDHYYNMIVFFVGAGEAGGDYSAGRYMGPSAYVANGGWNGDITIGNGTHKMIIVTIIQSTAFDVTSVSRGKVNTLLSYLRVKDYSLTGLSAGGHCAMIMATEDDFDNTSPYGPFAYADGISSIFSAQGVQPDDNSDYLNKTKNFVRNNKGGKYLGFWGTGDGSRMMPEMAASMNAAVSGSATVLSLADSHNKTAFDKYYGSTSAPNNYVIDGVNQNVYQWMLRQMDTTMYVPGGSSDTVTVNAGADKVNYLPKSYAFFAGTASTTADSITNYTWTKVSGPTEYEFLQNKKAGVNSSTRDTLHVNNLHSGTYTFRLTATDNLGNTGYDDVVVNVNATYVCNEATPITYTITETQPGQIYYVDGSAQPWRGGDTLEIAAGTYSVIQFGNVGGDQCRPLVIRPLGPIYTERLRFTNYSHHIVFDGKTAGNIRAVSMEATGSNLVNNLTLKNLNIGPNDEGVGVFLKQDPESTKPETWYQSYLMKNLVLDSLILKNIEGEGMYVGGTAPNADPYYGNITPIRLDSVTISNCIVDSTGWDGIQLSNARNGNKIFGNRITNYGLLNRPSQRSGLISGGNTNADIYDNYIVNGTGSAIQVFGYGVVNIYNNYADSAGEQSFYGLAALNLIETNPILTLNIYNNTIKNPVVAGAMDFRNPTSGETNLAVATLNNNTFCIPGATGTWQTTYLKFDEGWSGSNNVLDCGIIPPTSCNCFQGLFKF